MQKDERFGDSIGFGDMNGDGGTDVIVSAVRKSSFSYLGGSLSIFFS